VLCISIDRKRFRTLVVLLAVATVLPVFAAQETPAGVKSDAKPSARIDLSAVGFHEPSRMDRIAEYQPSLSLDFIDANHVLLTFNRKQLIKRQPECPADHEDRLMHAAVLEIPSGNVVTETDWYLHDRRRYLWPLSSGKFLLRKWNSLYIVDSNLHETLLLKSPKDLLWVSVTPDGSQVITETENERKTADSGHQPSSKTQPKFQVQFVDLKTLANQRTLLFNNFTNLTGTSAGYADVIRKHDVWLLRFGPSAAKRHNLARVRSQTVPVVLYPTDNTLLIGRCAASGCNYGVTAFALTGQRLWRQHWPGLRSFPEVTRSEDSSRFGVSTLLVEPASAGSSNSQDTDDDPFQPKVSERDVLRQEIQVFETASGSPVLSLSISPAVVTGQNVSLSPDGRRLALLRGSALELFDLPLLSEEEQTKLASLKADGLFNVASNADADWWDTPATASNSADVDSATADAPAGATTDEMPDSKATAQIGDTAQPAPAGPNSPTPSTIAEAAEKTAPSETLPVFKVSTKAVVVDVVVTDSKGHPVRGLSQQDFQLTEDNKPQQVRYFREFSDLEKSPEVSSGTEPATQASSTVPTSMTSPQAVASPVKSPNIFNNRAHAGQEGAVTMVLFDALNTPPQDQAYARLQLIKFLESKPKMSQFALCMLSSGDYPLRLVQGFTEDETLLLAAVKSKKGQPRNNRWQSAQTETRNSVATVAALAQEGRTSGFQNLVGTLQDMRDEQFVTDTSERASRTIDAMMLLARYLSGISGRKNIVWLSASFPIAINLGPVSNNPAIDNPNYTYKIKRATNLLADAQVAVYPVDVRGLQVFNASLDSGAAVGGPRSFQPVDPTSPNAAAPSSPIPQAMDFTDQASEQDTFTQFAAATGGKAFFNTNDIREAIATANEQGSNYYSFSYTSTNKVYDGKFRKIKLQLEHKGYKLYYRQGYFADEVNAGSKEAQLARNAIATAMHYGSPAAREVQFSVRVWPVGGKKKVDRAVIGEVKMASKKKEALPAQVETQHYVVDYTLDGSELRFIPQQNGSQHSSLALMISSFNSDGRMLTGVSNRAQSDLQSEVYRKVINSDIGFQQEIDIPIEATSMRLGVQDQMSNHLGTVDVPLPVPPDPNAPRIAKNRLPEIEPD
jgi:VWFA-related protein